MYIYIILILTLFILGIVLKPNKKKTNKKTFMIIAFILLALIAGCRSYTVGIDTEQFCKAYQLIGRIEISQAIENTRYETGFIILCKILNFITPNFQLLIFITSVFIMSSVCKFIYEESDDVIFSTLIFILINCFAMYMSTMRQAIALAIIILAYLYFLKNDKKVKYVISVIIASLFHQSAIVMLILLLFNGKKFKRRYYVVSILTAIMVFIFVPTIFSILLRIFPNYGIYSDSEFANSNYFASLLNSVVVFIFYTIGVIYWKKNKEKYGDKKDFYAFMISLNLIFYIATMRMTLLARITTYFNIFNIIWIPQTMKNIDNIRHKKIFTIMILLCLLAYWGIISIYRPEWYGVIPYKFFWEG